MPDTEVEETMLKLLEYCSGRLMYDDAAVAESLSNVTDAGREPYAEAKKNIERQRFQTKR